MPGFNENTVISFENPEKKLEKEYEKISSALTKLEEKYHFTRLDPYTFESEQPGYSREEIAQDIARLEKKRAGYKELSLEEQVAKLKADFLERVIVVGGSHFGWFGKNAETFLTSEVDDEINYIDGYVKFKPKTKTEIFRTLGLDFDATFTTDMGHINTKIHALKSDLDGYRIPKLKYIHDDIMDKNGLELPKVILGCDNESLDEIIDIVNKGEFDLLEQNPIQHKLLIQAEALLSAFKERYGKQSAYFKRTKEANVNDKDKYDNFDLEHRKASRLFDMNSQILGLIQQAGEEKGSFYPSLNEKFSSDAVHNKILYAASQINKQK
jgi:hypothetical protein